MLCALESPCALCFFERAVCIENEVHNKNAYCVLLLCFLGLFSYICLDFLFVSSATHFFFKQCNFFVLTAWCVLVHMYSDFKYFSLVFRTGPYWRVPKYPYSDTK